MKRTQKNFTHHIRGKSHFTLKGWPFGCLFLLLMVACPTRNKTKDYSNQYLKIDSLKLLVRSGDLIVRNGKDEVSRAARKFNRKDTSFSHCGIIQLEHDSIFVYHALGGRENPSRQLMRQPIDSFCNPVKYDKIAVFRYPMNTIQVQKLHARVMNYYAEKLAFDIFFNYDSNDKMYCSEFVFKSYNFAFNGAITSFLHTDQEPVFVSVDDLYMNTFSREVKRLSFNF